MALKVKSHLFKSTVPNIIAKCYLSVTTFRLQTQVEKIVPEYPPIVDMSIKGLKRHNRQVLYDSIKDMPTVYQKMLELNCRQMVYQKKYALSPVPFTYNASFFHQFVTRTHLIKEMPMKLLSMNVEKEMSDIKNALNDAVLSHFCNHWQAEDSKSLSRILNDEHSGALLVKRLVSHCYKKLSHRNDYIRESTIQPVPRIESFWWHQGFESKEELLHEQNLCFSYSDFPSMIIRTKAPLNPILDMNDPLCATPEVPNHYFHPKTYGIEHNTLWLASVPGFWPGDPHEFPFLLVRTPYQLKELLGDVENYDLSRIENSVGIMSSFGLLNSIANYQGFTPFQDLTYPLTTQTILTDGRDFTFFVYQLNTIAFHSDVDTQDRRNICWSSGKLRLFDTVEDGSLKGVNDDVYRMLLRFLLNVPRDDKRVVLKPYLGPENLSEEEAYYRKYLVKDMFSQAPDPAAHEDEIPTWVQIYKLHKDAPLSPYIKLE